MSALTWDEAGKRFYETGVDKVVLFVQNGGAYGDGVAWSGVKSITEKPSGAEDTKLYADNMKYLTIKSAEEFGATIEAFTYPDEWAECDGSAEVSTGVTIGQQARKIFGLAYRTKIGNDQAFDDFGYKIHLIYGAQASPSERANNTINDSPETADLSWEISTTPVNVAGFKPTSTLVIDSTKVDPDKLKSFEEKLYGSTSGDSALMTPDEVIAHFGASAAG